MCVLQTPCENNPLAYYATALITTYDRHAWDIYLAVIDTNAKIWRQYGA